MMTRRKKSESSRNASADKEVQTKQKKHKPNFTPSPNGGKRNQKTDNRNLPTKLLLNSNTNESPNTSNGNHSPDRKYVTAKVLNERITHVLSLKYANVLGRLKVTFPAKCTQSLVDCCIDHARNKYIPISDNVLTSQTFLKNHQPLMFIHVILMDVLQNKFPGRIVLQSLFELILGVNRSLSDEYDVENVIEMAAFAINSVFEKFPPCWLGANVEYRHFLLSQKKTIISGSHEILDNRTLFADIICALESLIQPTSAVIDVTINDSFNDSMEIQSFRKFESKNTQKITFDKLERDDKIDRVFVTLSMFVQLFEADLALWTLKNNRNPSAKIFNHSKGPLITSVLWTDGEPHQVNYCIKNILKLYVNYMNFPREYIKIIDRLVNLIYNVFELSEFTKSEDSEPIDYPQSDEKHSYFCDAFTKIIFENTGSVGSWLSIIDIIANPRLKLFVINALLTKIEHVKITMNPQTIYTALRQMENEFDVMFDQNVTRNNNDVQLKPSKSNATNPSTNTKYPYLQKIYRRAASELTNEQYAELHLIALNAYMSAFHTGEIRENMVQHDQKHAQLEFTSKSYKDDLDSFENTVPKPFDLANMESQQQKPFNDRLTAIGHNSHIYSFEEINSNSNIIVDVRADYKKYRKDFKFIDLIASQMPKLHDKFPALFPIQISALKQ